MEYKEFLSDSRGNGVAAYTKFICEYSKFENVAACFVEGKDGCYYGSKIKSELNEKYEDLFFPCNGKKEVERVQKMINENLNLKEGVKVLFFMDNDYGLDPKIENVYYTDYYSVENFYCQKYTFDSVLKRYFSINKYSSDYDICLSFYKKIYECYNKEIKKINAYALALRKKEKACHLRRFDLNNVKVKNLYNNLNFDTFNIEELNYEKIKNMFLEAEDLTESEYLESLEQIDEKKLRGKWELQFYSWFFNKLKNYVREGKFGLESNHRVKTCFENLMDVATEDAIVTDNFKEYIRTICY